MSIVFILVFIGMIYFLSILKSKYKKSFNFRVLTALCLGGIFGTFLNVVFLNSNPDLISNVTVFMSIFSTSYIRLLRMMVVPLIFIAMLTSVINAKAGASLRKIVTKVIGVLVFTVAVSAVVGIITVYLFNIDSVAIADTLSGAENVMSRQESLENFSDTLTSKNYAQYITSFIPTNIFSMFTGAERTDTLSTVLLAMFMGYAVLQLKKRYPEKVEPFINGANSIKEVVLSMVREVLKLTPYGVLAMISTFFAQTDPSTIGELFKFLAASYVAMLIMYIIHLILVSIVGLSPKVFAIKTWPVLLFGFSSRSSMSAVPMNISTQTDSLGVDEETASISASFGTSIGQNGCAGIYPAMLAIMAAQITGVEVNLLFIVQLVIVTAISSFGVAGVGGGATFAAITVLTVMGLDIRIAALLISIEALIDMARTALNINDSMLAGVITSKLNGTLNESKYNEKTL